MMDPTPLEEVAKLVPARLASITNRASKRLRASTAARIGSQPLAVSPLATWTPESLEAGSAGNLNMTMSTVLRLGPATRLRANRP